jgi:TPR repeat protein
MVQAARLFRQAAEKGNASAQYNLGVCYGMGEGVPQDMAQAAWLFRQAAEQGHANAQCGLGFCYDKGEGVPHDKAQAARLYRQAAEQGHAQAQCNLGVFRMIGEGVPQDKAQATGLLRQAAEQGLASAQCNLGVCYDKGEGVPQDKAQAARFYRQAATRTTPVRSCFYASSTRLARACRRTRGAGGAPVPAGGRARPSPSAEQSRRLLSEGRGVPQDMAQAARLFPQAADQGYAYAQHDLCVCYEHGKGVQYDMGEALALYRLAIAGGCTETNAIKGCALRRGEVCRSTAQRQSVCTSSRRAVAPRTR